MSTYNNSNYLYEFDVRANYYKLEGINAIFRNLLNIKRKYNNKKIIDATFIIVNPKGDKHINKDYYQRVPVYTVEDIVNKNLPIIYKDAKVKKRWIIYYENHGWYEMGQCNCKSLSILAENYFIKNNINIVRMKNKKGRYYNLKHTYYKKIKSSLIESI